VPPGDRGRYQARFPRETDHIIGAYVITINRELDSGGRTVVRLLLEKLGNIFSKQLIQATTLYRYTKHIIVKKLYQLIHLMAKES